MIEIEKDVLKLIKEEIEFYYGSVVDDTSKYIADKIYKRINESYDIIKKEKISKVSKC